MEFNEDNFNKLMADVKMQQESIDKLTQNNSDLKKEKKKAQDLASRFDGVDLDKLQSAANQLAKMEQDKLEQDGEFKKLYETAVAQANADKEAWDNEKKQLQLKNDSIIKSNDLSNALSNAGVDPVLREIATNSLIDQVGLVEGKSMVGNQSVTDFVKEWAETDVGKRFIPAGNTGGGGGGSEQGVVQAESKWFDPNSSEFNLTKQGQVRSANPELADKLAKKFANRRKSS